MADYKVVFRADEASTGDAALLWEPTCPAMLTAVQVSRNVQTSEAYLQVKIHNISGDNLGSVRGVATVRYDDKSFEDIAFEDLDVDLAPGGQKALKAVALPRGNVESATVRLTQISQTGGKWESTHEPTVAPQRVLLVLSEKAAKERRRRLEAAGINAAICDSSVQDNGDWWVCACGQPNVKSEHCCECGASKETLHSAEDESTLLASADEWAESVYQKAVTLSGDKGNVSSLSEAVALFGQVKEWKDSVEKIALCEEQIKKLKTASARRAKKIVSIAAAIVVVAVAAILFAVNVVIPNGKYSDAKTAFENYDYRKAISIFQDLGSYNDSADMLELARIGDALESEDFDTAISLLNEASAEGLDTSVLAESCYTCGQMLMDKKDYEKASILFEHALSVDGADEARKEAKYSFAVSIVENDAASAREAFLEIPDYKDAGSYLESIALLPTRVTNDRGAAGVISYDRVGHMTRFGDSSASFDSSGRLDNNNGYSFSYAEDGTATGSRYDSKEIDKYDAFGNKLSYQYADTIDRTYTYELDERGNPVSCTATGSVVAGTYSYKTEYDDAGNLTTITQSGKSGSTTWNLTYEFVYTDGNVAECQQIAMANIKMLTEMIN